MIFWEMPGIRIKHTTIEKMSSEILGHFKIGFFFYAMEQCYNLEMLNVQLDTSNRLREPILVPSRAYIIYHGNQVPKN